MQKPFFLCLFAILTTLVNAQDIIITTGQDTINCRIVSIGNERISYEQKSSDGYLVGRSIPVEEVGSYLREPQSSPITSYRRPQRSFLFRFNPGGSWMPWLFEDVEDASDPEEKLAKGFHLNASLHYLFSSCMGAGVQYSFFRSSAKNEYQEEHSPFPDFNYSISSVKEKQYINYVGASLIFRQFLDNNKKIQLSGVVSGGVVSYRGESKLSSDLFTNPYYSRSGLNTLITGRTFGATAGFSVEYFLSPSISVGLGGSLLYGRLNEVDVKERSYIWNNYFDAKESVKLDDPVKISRIDYSLALSAYF